jgi:ubiquinone biosynthesis protein UbiJ
MSITDLACAGLEEAINRALALDPEAAHRLGRLHGRVIGIEFAGPELRLYLVPTPSRLQVLARHEGEPDCLLRGSPLALARMDSSSKEGAEQLFSGKVEIEGDTELAHRFGAILSDLELDWEEQLSRFTGDVIAHEIGNSVRAVTGWGQKVLDTLGKDLREYVQEEVRLLPDRAELQDYLAKVDTLRDDAERLTARIERLHQELEVDKGDAKP